MSDSISHANDDTFTERTATRHSAVSQTPECKRSMNIDDVNFEEA